MTATFVNLFYSEWLKRKRSHATALIAGGSLFTPLVVLLVRLTHPAGLARIYASDSFWPALTRASWESMAIFFLPLGAILIASLIAQLEFRGNAWKQVHALPVHAAAVYFTKLVVIVILLAELLALFNVAVYVSGLVPSLLVPGVPRPRGAFWTRQLLADDALYFIDVLPIVAAQYVLALRWSNALVPIGAGFVAWVGALAAVSSRLAVWWPYSYPIIHYLQQTPKGAHFAGDVRIHLFAAIFFALLTLAGCAWFITRNERG